MKRIGSNGHIRIISCTYIVFRDIRIENYLRKERSKITLPYHNVEIYLLAGLVWMFFVVGQHVHTLVYFLYDVRCYHTNSMFGVN